MKYKIKQTFRDVQFTVQWNALTRWSQTDQSHRKARFETLVKVIIIATKFPFFANEFSEKQVLVTGGTARNESTYIVLRIEIS